MELNAILCNAAEVQSNQLYLLGGGIDRSFVPPGAPPPWGVTVAIGLTLRVPWTQTNQQHGLSVTLLDADDQPVEVPTGPNSVEPLKVEMSFNIGRPPQLQTGEEQTVSLAVAFPGLPFRVLGRYFFVLSVDGTELQRLPFSVVTQPGMTVAPMA